MIELKDIADVIMSEVYNNLCNSWYHVYDHYGSYALETVIIDKSIYEYLLKNTSNTLEISLSFCDGHVVLLMFLLSNNQVTLPAKTMSFEYVNPNLIEDMIKIIKEFSD